MNKVIDLSAFALNVNLDDKLFKEGVYNKRIELINIALGWEGATPKNNFIMHNVWKSPTEPSYVVCFGKYGKEYYDIVSAAYKGEPDDQIPDKARKNSNDMKPCVFRDGVIVDSFRGRLDDIFALLEECGRQGLNDVVKVLSVLFLRNALLLDHYVANGNYCYMPPKELVDYICANVPQHEGIPMEVYVHALDAIGFNEDVKYYTQGKLQKKKGVGRENNMKTYCYAAACVSGYEKWAGFAYKLIRGWGVAPITNKMLAAYLPELNVSYKKSAKRAPKSNSEIITVQESIDHFK